MNRCSKSGVLDRVFEHLQREQIVRVRLEPLSLDSTSINVHPDWTGALRKNGPQAIGKSRGGWTTKLHRVAADARTAVAFSLSPGQAHDAPEGRKLLQRMDRADTPRALIMDRAHEGDKTREQAVELGYEPVVPPKRNRVDPWE